MDLYQTAASCLFAACVLAGVLIYLHAVNDPAPETKFKFGDEKPKDRERRNRREALVINAIGALCCLAAIAYVARW